MLCVREGVCVYLLEAVSKADPLLLNELLEAGDGSVVWVQHDEAKGGQLSCSVPAITAVNHNWRLTGLHLIRNPQCSSQDQLHTHVIPHHF